MTVELSAAMRLAADDPPMSTARILLSEVERLRTILADERKAWSSFFLMCSVWPAPGGPEDAETDPLSVSVECARQTLAEAIDVAARERMSQTTNKVINRLRQQLTESEAARSRAEKAEVKLHGDILELRENGLAEGRKIVLRYLEDSKIDCWSVRGAISACKDILENFDRLADQIRCERVAHDVHGEGRA